jgi:hypothetical protein
MGAAVLTPYLAGAGLLALAGVEKLRRPHYTQDALRALGLRSGNAVVRAIGCIEVTVATAAVLSVLSGVGAAPAAAAVALLYAAFAVAVARLVRSGTPVRSCGCLGAAETPPSHAHALVNVACAGAAALYVVDPTTLRAASGGDPLAYAIALAAAGIALYLVTALIKWLPAAWKVTKLEPAEPDESLEGGIASV